MAGVARNRQQRDPGDPVQQELMGVAAMFDMRHATLRPVVEDKSGCASGLSFPYQCGLLYFYVGVSQVELGLCIYGVVLFLSATVRCRLRLYFAVQHAVRWRGVPLKHHGEQRFILLFSSLYPSIRALD